MSLAQAFVYVIPHTRRFHYDLSIIAWMQTIQESSEFNAAKKIANFLDDSTALCFTSPYLVSAGTRFKNSMRMRRDVESILEASHNEIVPFTFNDGNSPSKVLLLRWDEDCFVVDERFNQEKAFFNEIGQPADGADIN